MIDKSTRQHYAIQGGGPNYLGKQKMVKAPKKWKSSPNHPDTELAYITEPEKQVLIALNLHGGLEDGKPNRGPSGIISLQGDMGGWSGGSGSSGSGGGGHHGGGGGADRDPPPAPKPPPKPPSTPTKAPDWITGGDLHKDPVAEEQGFFDTEPKKTYKGPTHSPHTDIGPVEKPYEMVGGVKVPLDMRGVKGVDPREDPEQYFEKPGKDPFEVPEGERSIEDKLAIENWEKKQDWDLIKDMSDKGYDFNEIQSAVEKGLTQKAPTTDTRKQNLIDFGLRSIMPETGLERSLLSRMRSFVPGAQTGLSSLTDKMGGLGKYFNPGKMMTNYTLSKMGLGWINPVLGLASLFGFNNPLANIGTKWSGIPTKKGPDVPTERDGPEETQNTMQASIKKFQPTDQQTAQMDELRRKMGILQGYADKGQLNEQGINTLAQMNQLVNQYQVDPASIWGVA
jgi:hypothetical protein